MSRKKPAPDLIRGGYRFSEKDMRKTKRMSRKSGNRFSEKDMRKTKRMSRKSGYRFSEKDMRKTKESRANPDSIQSGCALELGLRPRI